MKRLLVLGLSVLSLAAIGCGGGDSTSTPDYKAETKLTEKKLAEEEGEEAICQQALPETETELRIYGNELNSGHSAGISLAELGKLVHSLELEVRKYANCIEETQETEIDLNGKLGLLSEEEEGFAAKKHNEAFEEEIEK